WPRLRPTCTLPSFVATIASEFVAGEYASWLMYERLPRLPLTRLGLFATQPVRPLVFAVMFSHTRVEPAMMWLHVVAAQSVDGRPPGFPGVPLKMSYGRMNEIVSAVQPPVI